MNIIFNHLHVTGLTEAQILEHAKAFQLRAMERGWVYGLQEAVDAMIDAFTERAQG
jgi:hypothetical protein